MSKAKEELSISYEEAITQLESIVKQMEGGNLSLGDSIKAYEEGIRLVKYCEQELGKYEKLISSYGSSQGDGSAGSDGLNGETDIF